MTHDPSNQSGGVAPVINPSSQTVVASLAFVVLGPLMAMVVYTNPMLGVGGIAGLLARPALGLGRRVTRQLTHFTDRNSNMPRGSTTGISLTAGGE